MLLIGTRKRPKGPNSSKLKHYEFILSGTILGMELPLHNNKYLPEPPGRDSSINIYDINKFGRMESNNNAEPLTLGLASMEWCYFGIPILDGTGDLGEIKFMAMLSYMPEFSSLFRPKVLEGAVERVIYTSPYLYKNPGQCRLNWQVVRLNANNWISHDAVGWAGFHNAESCTSSVWQIPIADQFLLTLSFQKIIRFKGTNLEKEQSDLIDLIMNNISLSLSSDAQAQKTAVEAQFPDEKLSESLPPYEFEEFELSNEYELLTEVGARYDFELPYEEVKKLWEEEIIKEKRILKETRARVIASHLRFKGAE